jgi:4-hydroxybenzoate polyprenyltransferase
LIVRENSKNNKIYVLLDLLNFLYNEYVYGGHIAGTALLGMILTFSFINSDTLDLNLLLIAYFVPLIVYSYDHYRDIESDKITNPDRVQYLEKKSTYYRYIIGTYIAVLVALVIFGGQEIVEMLAFIAIIVGGGLLYAASFKNFTKYIPAYKNIFVSLEWALAAAFLMVIYNHQDVITVFTVIIFTFVFLKYCTNTIFCDLKDIEPDSEKGLKTVPVMIGFNKTIVFLCVLSIVTLLPLILGVYIQILPIYALLFTIFAVYDIVYILLAYINRDTEKWHKFGFLADIEITLWPIVLIPIIYILTIVW